MLASRGDVPPIDESLLGRMSTLARALDVTVTPETAEALSRWLAEARTWNAKLDLTAARTDAALVEVLVADALVAADHTLLPEGARILDVGTGAGTPGLALAIVRPDLSATLIEPLQKRVAFLRSVVGVLGLSSRVRVENGRIEPDAPRSTVEADVYVSRATFAPEISAAVGLTLAPAALLFLVDETPPLPAGARVTAEKRYALPSTGAARRLLRVERG